MSPRADKGTSHYFTANPAVTLIVLRMLLEKPRPAAFAIWRRLDKVLGKLAPSRETVCCYVRSIEQLEREK